MVISFVLSDHQATHDRVAPLFVRVDHVASRVVDINHGIK
jgi:hypothetical protein